MATKAIVGEKVGMTQVWDDQNRAVPVTVLKVAPVRVVQIKTPETDGYTALQVTWGFRRNSTLGKPQLGHYAKAGVNPGRKLVELRLDDVADYSVGQEIAADLWQAGVRWERWLPWDAPWPLKLCRFIPPVKPLPLLTAMASTRSPGSHSSAVSSWPTSNSLVSSSRSSMRRRPGSTPAAS